MEINYEEAKDILSEYQNRTDIKIFINECLMPYKLIISEPFKMIVLEHPLQEMGTHYCIKEDSKIDLNETDLIIDDSFIINIFKSINFKAQLK